MKRHRTRRSVPPPAPPPTPASAPAPSPYAGKELADEIRRLGELVVQARSGPLNVKIHRDKEGRMSHLTIERK